MNIQLPGTLIVHQEAIDRGLAGAGYQPSYIPLTRRLARRLRSLAAAIEPTDAAVGARQRRDAPAFAH